ncbi:MAG: hypothetical protein GFH27_549283n10 [Chloroflexi bacterium AL-W]|nr:hypothetical protein [Chloroflexi bacterium AL-N1]NOK64870.1 hypothetical protein [Chloroflexi bacterium AL-N10]NOK76640.1 hypothetical protein [Chloroflexi bacterium AL-N5]NOK80131.1 hypothetical protein [Chloroflexi bacterium AL-W]NOK86644.1 hypothetical protein [Chloroflexi bacterium AL-N15]
MKFTRHMLVALMLAFTLASPFSASAATKYIFFAFLDGQWYPIGQPVSLEKCEEVKAKAIARGIPAACVSVEV